MATIDDLEAAGRAMHELGASFGVSAEDAEQAISDAMSKVEFDPVKAAVLVQMNPSLSAFQKRRLTRLLLRPTRA